MSIRRLAAIFWVEFRHSFRRPLFIFLAVILILNAWGLSTGKVAISSGDSEVGGTKAWITSEFAQTQMMTFIILLLYGFFIAKAAGMTLLRDQESKADAIAAAFGPNARPDPHLPSSMLGSFAQRLTVLIDPAAAARL